MPSLALNDKMLEVIARRFRTLGEPFRLRLLQALETQERTVGELVDVLAANQPNVSKHLQILYEAGVVTRRREGTSVFYSIGEPVVFKLCDLVCRSATEQSRAHLEEISADLVKQHSNWRNK